MYTPTQIYKSTHTHTITHINCSEFEYYVYLIMRKWGGMITHTAYVSFEFIVSPEQGFIIVSGTHANRSCNRMLEAANTRDHSHTHTQTLEPLIH